MRITVNGEAREVDEGLSVAELLKVLGVRSERVAVELNQHVVRRESRESRILAENDRVEIVSFVGGG